MQQKGYAKSAMFWECAQVDEFEDEVNEITKVFVIFREEKVYG